MKILLDFLLLLRRSFLGNALARAWHLLAPSFSIPRQVWGLTFYFDFRDNPIWWWSSAERIEHSEAVLDMLATFKGTIWDVGSNVGVVAIRSAALGHHVIAFDISRKALDLLRKSAATNNLRIETVNRAFSTHSFSYKPPKSADTENTVHGSVHGSARSITFLEAAELFPMPNLLKMDIEGGEEEFLACPEFKEWLRSNSILWVVEFHSPRFAQNLWDDCEAKLVDGSHYAIRALPIKQSSI